MMATLSTNDLLLGIGLVLELAVGSQLVATLVGLPAIVVLLPMGAVTGDHTSYRHKREVTSDQAGIRSGQAKDISPDQARILGTRNATAELLDPHQGHVGGRDAQRPQLG